MALDRLDALETRIRDLVKLIQELKKRNAGLEDDLRSTRQRLADESDSNRRWARERSDIKARVEKVLGDIELLEAFEERKEVALTKTTDVEIYGQRYSIKGDETYIRRLAGFVDGQMRQLAEGMNTTTCRGLRSHGSQSGPSTVGSGKETRPGGSGCRTPDDVLWSPSKSRCPPRCFDECACKARKAFAIVVPW